MLGCFKHNRISAIAKPPRKKTSPGSKASKLIEHERLGQIMCLNYCISVGILRLTCALTPVTNHLRYAAKPQAIMDIFRSDWR